MSRRKTARRACARLVGLNGFGGRGFFVASMVKTVKRACRWGWCPQLRVDQCGTSQQGLLRLVVTRRPKSLDQGWAAFRGYLVRSALRSMMLGRGTNSMSISHAQSQAPLMDKIDGVKEREWQR